MHFHTDYPGAVAAFKGEASFTLDYSRDRILHCLAQLTVDQVWHRHHADTPQPMNAIGNTVLHVAGNLRQWITPAPAPGSQGNNSALGSQDHPTVAGSEHKNTVPFDDRDRPAEFAATADNPVAGRPDQLAGHLRAAVDHAKAAIASLNKDHLLEPRIIQGFEVTGMGAIWHSVAHLEAHAQETIFATRLILGPAYQFKDHY